jgi:hypothetical protein
VSATAPARAPVRAPARAQPRGQSRASVSAPARSARPQLRLVDAPRIAAGPLPFALVVAGLLGAGLVVLLMLHTLAAQDAFTLHKLQRQTAALGDVEQQLTVANQQAQAPSALAARARALGMVPTGSLRIVRHRNGRIVAVASALPVPVPAASPTAAAPSAAATPTASTTPAPSTSPVGGARPSASASPKATTSQPPAKRRRPH